MLSAVLTLTLALTAAPDGAVHENALARAALDAFASKCVQCHGPEVAHPKAGFGYVTDLERLVGSGKYVVPGAPDRSELWQEIEEGDMPPDSARAGPLTAQETDAIRRWIAGGAPALLTGTADGGEAASTDPLPSPASGVPHAGPRSPEDEGTLSSRLIILTGRFHVLAVHFPIALLVVAALVEAWDAVRKSATVSPAGRVCLVLGAISATAAAGLGWIHAAEGFAGPLSNPASITGLHRWVGTVVGVAAPVVAAFSERDARRGARTPAVRIAVFLLALAVGGAGHFGGLLTHGTGYFDA